MITGGYKAKNNHGRKSSWVQPRDKDGKNRVVSASMNEPFCLLSSLCYQNYQGLFSVSQTPQHSIIPSFPGGLDGKESACNVGDPALIPESGRSPEGHGNPLQYARLESSIDRSLAVCGPWGHKELDTAERVTHTHHPSTTLSPPLSSLGPSF